MAQGNASKAFIGFATEVTYGTLVEVGAGGFNRVKRVTVKNRADQTAGNRNLGIPWATCQRIHMLRSSGEIAMDMSYQGFDRFFLHMFGLASDSATNGAGANAGAWTHVFTPKIAQVVGGSLTPHMDLLKMNYPGGKLSQMRWNFRRNDPLEMVLQFIGKPHLTPDPPAAAEAAPTFLEEVGGGTSIPCINPIETTGGFVFSIGDAGGTNYTAVGIIEGDFTIDKPHQEDRGNIGSRVIGEPIPNGEPIMTFTGNIRKEFLDNSLILPFIQGIAKAFKWSYTSPTIIMGGGSTVYTWELEAKYVRWLESPPEVPGPGPMEDSLPFICESPDGTTPPITLTVKNRLANAAT